jgi:hypothetical protein
MRATLSLGQSGSPICDKNTLVKQGVFVRLCHASGGGVSGTSGGWQASRMGQVGQRVSGGMARSAFFSAAGLPLRSIIDARNAAPICAWVCPSPKAPCSWLRPRAIWPVAKSIAACRVAIAPATVTHASRLPLKLVSQKKLDSPMFIRSLTITSYVRSRNVSGIL